MTSAAVTPEGQPVVTLACLPDTVRNSVTNKCLPDKEIYDLGIWKEGKTKAWIVLILNEAAIATYKIQSSDITGLAEAIGTVEKGAPEGKTMLRQPGPIRPYYSPGALRPLLDSLLGSVPAQVTPRAETM